MTIADGFSFALGKAVADLAIVAFIISGCLLVVAVATLTNYFQKKRRNWK